MKSRDRHYIEDRLIAPSVGVLEAIDRMHALGLKELADQTMKAVQEFTDVLREIRKELPS